METMNNNLPVDNPYLYAVLKAMQAYLDEDMKDYALIGVDIRLRTKLDAAKKLFPEERKELQRAYLRK